MYGANASFVLMFVTLVGLFCRSDRSVFLRSLAGLFALGGSNGMESFSR